MGNETRLCYTESVLIENRIGIIVGLRLGQATGRGEREQGLELLHAVRWPHRIEIGDEGSILRSSWRAAARSTPPTWHGVRGALSVTLGHWIIVVK